MEQKYSQIPITMINLSLILYFTNTCKIVQYSYFVRDHANLRYFGIVPYWNRQTRFLDSGYKDRNRRSASVIIHHRRFLTSLPILDICFYENLIANINKQNLCYEISTTIERYKETCFTCFAFIALLFFLQ